jgi:hypothetical protein
MDTQRSRFPIEKAAKLAGLVVSHNIGSVAEAIDFAADAARDPQTLSEAELARSLSKTRRLTLFTVIIL